MSTLERKLSTEARERAAVIWTGIVAGADGRPVRLSVREAKNESSAV
jgi:hypothetical protein